MLPINDYFEMAKIIRKNSSYKGGTPVGAVLIDKEGEILSTGWNDYPEDMDRDFLNNLGRKNRSQFALHAEVMTLMKCANLGITANGGEMFITRYPCFACVVAMKKAGIRIVHFLNEKDYTERWGEEYMPIIKGLGIRFIEYDENLNINVVI